MILMAYWNVKSVVDEMANVPPIVICATSISKILRVNVTVTDGGIIMEQPADGIC